MSIFEKTVSEIGRVNDTLLGLTWVCRTPKFDLSITTKCDRSHNICSLVTTKAGAKYELLLNKPTVEARGGFVEHLSWT